MHAQATLRSLGALAGLLMGAFAAVALLPRPDIGIEAAARPSVVAVRAWADAIAAAGVPLYTPPAVGTPSSIILRGVPGDRTRPVEARYGNGLTTIQAQRDVLPAEETSELVTVDRADDAWWQVAADLRRLAVRRGDTLILLTGLPADELVAIAATLAPAGQVP